MRVVSLACFVVPRLSAAFLAGLVAAALARSTARAAADRTFVVYGGDGYGIDDCLSSKAGCGRSVADAWCSTHGLSRAVAFGSSADVTRFDRRSGHAPAGGDGRHLREVRSAPP